MATITPPTVSDLSALMRSRTEGQLAYQGEFNDDTRPTADEAAELLDIATAIVTAKVGANLSPGLVAAAGKAILFKAAALVEVTYYPEQANDDQSAYELYQAQFDELIATLVTALKDDRPNQARVYSAPTYGRNGYDPDNPPA